jgi:hypothetical protein
MRVLGLALCERDSGGNLQLASWHNPRRTCWGWIVSRQRYRRGDEGRFWFRVGCDLDRFQPYVAIDLLKARRLRITWQPWALGRQVEPYVRRPFA